MELPDKRLDRKLSFGCGAVLGFVASSVGVLSVGYGLKESLAVAAVVATAFGILAVVFGDRFLNAVTEWLSW